MTGNDQHLDDLLRQLPRHMPFPPTPDLADRIVDILPERPTMQRRHPSGWLFAAVVIAAMLLIAVLPGPRHAVADWLGLPGIRIEVIDRHSTNEEPTSIGSTLLFGERSTLEDAQGSVPFGIKVPKRDDMHDPDEVWLRTSGDVAAVSLIYAATDDLPEIGDTGVGMLVMEFQTSEEAPFLAKRSMGNGMLSLVRVNGAEGFWIENGELVTLPPALNGVPDHTRRSGNVLIWSDGATTFRLETALNQDAAMRIAESLVPYRSGTDGN